MKLTDAQIRYQQSEMMAADGLTKALPAGKWTKSLDKLGLEDIAGKITDQEINLHELEQRMEAFEL